MKTRGLLFRVLAATGVFAGLYGPAEQARAEYPDRPVTFVVSYEPGGATDAAARIVAEKLTETTGQPFVIENRPGASGITGNQHVQNAKPDGYTLLFSTSGPLTVLPAVNDSVPYDPVEDFESIVLVSQASPYYILTTPETGMKDLKTLIEKAKATPGSVKWGSPGPGATNSAAGQAFADLIEAEMVEVPYKGNGPVVLGLLGNHIHFMYANTVSFLQLLQEAKVVPLAVLANERTKQLPDVPTVGEAGYPELMELTSWRIWQNVMAPNETPTEIVQYLNKAINEVLDDPEVKAKFEKIDLEPMPQNTPEEAQQRLAKEVEEWKSIAERLNLKVQ